METGKEREKEGRGNTEKGARNWKEGSISVFNFVKFNFLISFVEQKC